ncbi:ECF transporter S component [Alloscardovia criceti]|uniref:ECF transporter S component n=1 Tax=Alloscardovia criceti TaxID=356828 RepID=UPI0003728B64|nr:ECF transporter S component [Alloscardovia criceti]
MSEHTHNTTTENTDNYWTSQRIAIYALFSTLAIVLSFIQIPLMPAAPFLKYDPSGIVVLLAGFAYGPLAAVIVGVLSSLPHIFTDPIGGLILVACTLAFSLPSAWIYSKKRTRQGALISMVTGSVSFVFTAIVLNLLITPFYTGTDFGTVLAMVIPILLPFNIIKAVLHSVVTTFCYKPMNGLLKSYIASQKSNRRV